MRKAGNRVRIGVQLVSVADSSHLWSETYDRTLDDIFAVQDDIAQSVVKELRTTLLGETGDSDASGRVKAEVSQAAKGRATDLEVNRLYLQARHFLDRDTPDDLSKAIRYLKEALERDPQFALAWSLLGAAHTREADKGLVPASVGYSRAREAVQRALALEPDLAEGHAHMAWIQKNFDWDWSGAQSSFARALQLAPQNAIALRRAGTLAWTLGRMEEGFELTRRALEQDPLSAHAYSNLGAGFHDADRLAESEAAFRKALELAPQKAEVHAGLAVTLVEQGRHEEALNEAMREQDEGARLSALAVIHHAMGNVSESDAALLDLVKHHAETMAYPIAEAHSRRGEIDAAFEWLERAYAQRDGGLVGVKMSPPLRSLHGDSRWGAFLKRMRPPRAERWAPAASVDGNGINDPMDSPFDERWLDPEKGKYWEVEPLRVFDQVERDLFKEKLADSMDLAFALEDAVNNSSLVLMFLIGKYGLLMTGDAQWGSWDSWMTGDVGEETFKRVTLFKLGHHGSHNATPRSIINRLPENLTVLVPTHNTPFPTIPEPDLMTALATRSKDRVVRSDNTGKLPSGCTSGDFWIDFQMETD